MKKYSVIPRDMTSSFYLVGVIVNESFKDHTYIQTHGIQNSTLYLHIAGEEKSSLYPSKFFGLA